MKTHKIISPVAFISMILFISLFLLSSFAEAADNPFQVKFPFKTAIIKYKHGGTEVGSSEVYYKGMSSANHKKVKQKLMGLFGTKKTETLTITTPERVTIVDLKKKTATAVGNQFTYLAEEFEKLSEADKKIVRKNNENIGRYLSYNPLIGMPQVSKGTFMNRPVDILTFKGRDGPVTQVWHGTAIILKTEGSIMALKAGKKALFDIRYKQEAISIEENVAVPDEKFEVPDGIEVVFDKKSDDKLKELAKAWLETLKDPELEKKMTARSMDEDTQDREEKEEEPGKVDQAKEKVKKSWKKLFKKD